MVSLAWALRDASCISRNSLQFSITDTEEPDRQKTEGETFDGAFNEISLWSRTEGAYKHQLRSDVTYFSNRLEAEEGHVDIVDLACMLVEVGHDVLVRSALGGGKECFKNLYHDFLLVKGRDDSEGRDVVVECAFREHFHIPCATPRYTAALRAVPLLFVGTLQDLSPLVEGISQEMSAAFAAHDLTRPPWRTAQSLMSKWAPKCIADRLPVNSPRVSAGCSPPLANALSCTASLCRQGSGLRTTLVAYNSEPPAAWACKCAAACEVCRRSGTGLQKEPSLPPVRRTASSSDGECHAVCLGFNI